MTSWLFRCRQSPLRIAPRPGGGGGWPGVAGQPALDVVVEELFGPEQSGEGLAGDQRRPPAWCARAAPRRRTGRPRSSAPPPPCRSRARDRSVALLGAAGVGVQRRVGDPDQPDLDDRRTAGRDRDRVVQCGFRADLRRVDGVGAVHDVVVDPVLGVGADVGAAEQPLVVGLVVTEQRLGAAVPGEHQRTGLGMVPDDPVARPLQVRHRVVRVSPRPGVAEPQRGQHVQGGLVRPGVLDRDPHQQIPRAVLGVVDSDDPVTVLGEDPGVDELVFGFQLAPGGRSRRPDRRRGTHPAGSGSARCARNASACRPGTTSTP